MASRPVRGVLHEDTPRNLFGFKDGTKNVKAEEVAALDEHVWVAAEDDTDADWLAGGSYLAARRVSMTIEVWDRQPLGDQEQRHRAHQVARVRRSSGGAEFDEPDFALEGRSGPIVPVDAHVAVVHPDHNDGVRMLRCGYDFVDGTDSLGGLDAGLFFLAFVRDPAHPLHPRCRTRCPAATC